MVGHVLNYLNVLLSKTDLAHMVNNDISPCGANVIKVIATFRGYNRGRIPVRCRLAEEY
jgi:hypothetical protein